MPGRGKTNEKALCQEHAWYIPGVEQLQWAKVKPVRRRLVEDKPPYGLRYTFWIKWAIQRSWSEEWFDPDSTALKDCMGSYHEHW
jgi:hypothetical protein